MFARDALGPSPGGDGECLPPLRLDRARRPERSGAGPGERLSGPMSVFYIHVHGRDFQGIDLIGSDFADSEAARAAALRAAKELLADEVTNGKLPLEDWIEVEDADHRPVMTVPLSQVTP